MAGLDELVKLIRQQQSRIEALEDKIDGAYINPALLLGDSFMTNGLLPQDVQDNLEAFAPTGCVLPWAAADSDYHPRTPPAGWVLCDGTLYDNNIHPGLAAAIFGVFGFGTAIYPVTVNESTNLFGKTAHGLANDTIVYLTGYGSDLSDLPAPLSTMTLYYVVNSTANTFQLSSSVGGAPIDITSVGGFSPISVYKDFKTPDLRKALPFGWSTTEIPYHIGKTGGETEHELTAAETAAHTHPGTGFAFNVAAGVDGTAAALAGSANGWATGNAGAGTAHNNMPPFVVMGWIIKT